MTSPFVPTYKQFPVQDAHNLEKQLVNSYNQIAVALNHKVFRLIGNDGIPIENPIINIIGAAGITVTGNQATNTLTISPGGSSILSTLTGNSGGPISPVLGNINTVGTGSITIAGAGNTLTTQLTGLTNHNVLVGAGTATITTVPPSTAGFVLTSNGAALDPSFQAVSATGAITTITGNSGGAESPSGGNFNILGTGSITVAGSANTETVQLTGLTNHSLLVGAGTATITNLGVASNGQLPIGSAGADPVLANLTPSTGISITNGAGTITIAASGTSNFTVTAVNNAASPYTVLSTDNFLAVDTSGGAVTINLPNAPATGKVYYIKDSKGTSAGANITVTTPGGVVTIDAGTSYILNVNYQAIGVVFDGASYEVF